MGAGGRHRLIGPTPTVDRVPAEDGHDGADRPSATRRRRLGAVAVAVATAAVLVGVLVAVTVRWFVIPGGDPPAEADAVVVLLGGDGERLERALELIDGGTAPVLVLSIDDWPWREWRTVMPYCLEDHEYEVVCLTPEPQDTAGEAQTVGALASERGWDTLVVVTSDYHAHRARIHFERCVDGDVHVTPAPASLSPRQLVREWIGTIDAELLDRSC